MSLIKNQVSPNQLYFLDCCRHKIKPTGIVNADAERVLAVRKGYLTEEGVLTHQALQLLEEFETFLVKTKKKVATEVLGDNFLERIKEYREIFPAKRLPHGELARQTVQELKDKFIWFFKTYPDFSWELVLEATDYYVFTKSKEDFKFMATSSYFIQKTDMKTKVVKSLLADYCQAIVDDPEILKS